MHGQPAHEKTLNITNYQKNGKKNYNDHHPTAVRMVIIKKITNVAEDVEKRELLGTFAFGVLSKKIIAETNVWEVFSHTFF